MLEAKRKFFKACHLVLRHEFRRGLIHGIAAAVEHEQILRALDLRTVVDVGANIGQFSLLTRTLFPDAQIYAFEPQDGPANTLERYFRNESVTLYRSAIGRQSGKMPMYISARHDSSSFLPISAAMSEIFPGTENVRMESVHVAPLHEFLKLDDIRRPALLKIDVQGGELEVLRGSETLLDHFDFLYIELSFIELYSGQPLCSDVIRYLDDRGFKVRGVANLSQRNGMPIQADFLFKSRNSPLP